MIAIGGLNHEPYSDDKYTGRLRRFYVKKEYRRKGIGVSQVDSLYCDDDIWLLQIRGDLIEVPNTLLRYK
jgi:GNAT superfamily N-acetyltransferase